MHRYASAAAALLLTLTGCANLTTVGRSHQLPGNDTNKSGIAVHLDAKQRVVYQSGMGRLCAEPSPDALSAYAASFGGSGSAQGYGSAAVAQALSESSASIGLRTQSITLMRDALYRICELYYSGGLNEVAAQQLLARSQDMTIGVLAIEQLTGAVAAQPVGLTGKSSANALAAATDAAEQLENARRFESEQQKLVDADKKAIADFDVEIVAKEKQINELPQDADPKVREKLQKELTDLQTAKQKRVDQLAIDTRNLQQATALRERLEQQVNSSLASASASAESGVQFGTPIVGGTRMTDASATIVSTKVAEIVSDVLDQDHLLEACVALLSQVEINRGKGIAVASETQSLVGMCGRYSEDAAAKLAAKLN
jgi:hypothetical protein